MKVFSYSQYIKCIHTLRLNAVMQLAEEETEYNLSQVKKKDSQHYLIKKILENKKEVAQFINQFLNPRETVKEEDLVPYTSNFITKKYKEKEIDLIYKLKNKEIFFLIEHLSYIDHRMPYRILNYCIDIMQESCRNKKIGKSKEYAMVVPIIIYTGEEKWKVQNNVKEDKMSHYAFKKYKINLEYNFIDIHHIPKRILLEKNSLIAYFMFSQKGEKEENLQKDTEKISS